jgi:hypothetical protein
MKEKKHENSNIQKPGRTGSLSDVAGRNIEAERFAVCTPDYTDFVFVYQGKPIIQTSIEA